MFMPDVLLGSDAACTRASRMTVCPQPTWVVVDAMLLSMRTSPFLHVRNCQSLELSLPVTRTAP